MTNRKIKEELKNVYQAPVPQRKNDFLRSVRQEFVADSYQKISILDFLLTQLHYISSWVWGLSILVFIIALHIMNQLGEEAGWTISAMVPFISALVVVELHRSTYFQMNELEQATRFSLKAVTYARLCILGINNLILLVAISPFMMHMCQVSFVQVITYLLCPYTLTAFCSLYVLRIWRSNENIFACAGISIGVSLLCFFQERFTLAVISDSMYVLITLVLLVLMVMEYKRYFIFMEELVWN